MRFLGVSVVILCVLGVVGVTWILIQPHSNPLPSDKAELEVTNVGICSLAVTPDGETLVAGGAFQVIRGEIHVIDTKTGKTRFRLEGHKGPVRCLVVTKDGKLLASAGDDGAVVFWNLATGRMEGRLPSQKEPVYALAMSLDGERLASGGGDGFVKLWNARTHELERTLVHSDNPREAAVHGILFLPDGKTLCSTGANGVIRFWDFITGKEKTALIASKRSIRVLALSRDGTTLACGCDDKVIRSYFVPKSTEGSALEGHDEYIECLAFSPVDDALCSGSGDRTIRMWDLESGEERLRIMNRDTSDYVGPGGGGGVNVLAFSPNGRRLYSGGTTVYKGKLAKAKGVINVWDPATGERIASFEFESGPP